MAGELVTYFGYGSLVNRDTRPPDEQAFPARLYGWQRVWGHLSGRADASAGSRANDQQPTKPARDDASHPGHLKSDQIETDATADKHRQGQASSARLGANNAESSQFLPCCSLTVRPLSEVDKHKQTIMPFIDGVVVTIPRASLPVLDERERGYDRIRVSRDAFNLPASCTANDIFVYVSQPVNRGFANEDHPILQSYVDCVLAGYCAVFDQTGLQQFVDGTVGWHGTIINDRLDPHYPRAVKLAREQLDQFDKLIQARRLIPEQ